MCDVVNCGRAGILRPILLLRCHPDHEPAHVDVGITVCKQCSKLLTAYDVLTEEKWNDILRGFVKMKRMLPNRDLLEIKFERILGVVV